MGWSFSLAVFLAAAFGDLGTYVITSVQLALAFPSEVGGFMASFTKFAGIFAFTQIPLAISEGLLTVVVMNFLKKYNLGELKSLRVLSKEAPNYDEKKFTAHFSCCHPCYPPFVYSTRKLNLVGQMVKLKKPSVKSIQAMNLGFQQYLGAAKW